ncbi:uncharacterized protein TRIADDRAFT_53227 [Trichoplax adhaerens]|uniref:1-acyl-sn-glycerol-3-phosphate acyltransferase n=1 Tax=Trichoplax adhaerens TaxID=10228 RepID=B3RNN2_TRIAD|nr:hypothetical protein TRIADDRAFT_53227 [Trichoplax adhaerens]EDV28048.1 hypothetical protein TRIADDRAFT_53227 [Trichoplax adhaerens]|eukprot:XP_002109882.1 hypothetical protein TRIADDRAFT_53227 [Trichoplax adhaerens]
MGDSNFYYVAVTILLIVTAMYWLSSAVRFYVRLGCFTLIVIILANVVSIIALVYPRNLNSYYISKFFGIPLLWLLKPILNIKVKARGLQHFKQCQSPYIIVCNHQSSLDLYPLLRIVPPKTVAVAKKELLYTPIIGQAAWLTHTVFVDRGDHASAVETLNKVIQEMKKKSFNLWVFPEGKRNQTGKGMLPFKKGAFHIALRAQIPIVPVVIRPYEQFYNRKEKKLRREGNMYVTVLDPIDTEGLSLDDTGSLAESTRQKMLEVLQESDDNM